ncbi:13792_t:CDS:2 [Acaulospora morrowiae]|uniref:13792_t:CDS:1 n=1 Tax=Acaulospora morrowiae TaxID=94023 RepID=A0A9N9FP27_9GLOM|nr:13792_t:CDS:2 [Acaulospora morrowiae]
MSYEISEQGISITYDDEIAQAPENTNSEPGADGLVNYYQLLEIDDPKNILWRKKLGKGLADFLKSSDRIDEIPPESAILKNLPPGYLLYEHRKQNSSGGMRTDTYLYGKHRFRSPNEFMLHLFWLASDKSEHCKCKYCGSSSGVSSLNSKQQSKSTATNKEKLAKKHAKKEAPTKEKRGRKKGVKKADQPMDIDAETQLESLMPFDDNILSNEPKVKKQPGESNAIIFRVGEIVWLDVKKIMDNDLQSKCNEINTAPIKYWPAIILKVKSDMPDQISESDIFTLRVLMLRSQKEVGIGSIQPWIMCTPENTKSTKARKTRSNFNVDLEDPNPDHVVNAYKKAIQKAREITETYTTIKPYIYRHSEDGPAEFKKLENYSHFRAILFGPEILEEDDMVRLIPAHNESSSSDDPAKRGSFLQITSIYQDSKKRVKITGDAYDRGESVGENKYKWHPVNADSEEFTVELSDIAGRFYPLWPDMTEQIKCIHAKKLQQRQVMYVEDSSEINSDLWLKMKPQSEVQPVTANDEPSNRQIAKRKMSSASGTTRKRQYVKHASPLKASAETVNNRRAVEIEQSETTKMEITIDTSVSGNVPGKLSVTPQGGSSIKFLDIERVIYPGTNDNDALPSVLSPDTPTFDSEEETKDTDTLLQATVDDKE